MANFRNIIVPEAIKSLTSKDQSVLSMIDCMDDLVNGDESLSSLITSIDNELHGNPDLQVRDWYKHIATNFAKLHLRQRYIFLLQRSREWLPSSPEPEACVLSFSKVHILQLSLSLSVNAPFKGYLKMQLQVTLNRRKSKQGWKVTMNQTQDLLHRRRCTNQLYDHCS